MRHVRGDVAHANSPPCKAIAEDGGDAHNQSVATVRQGACTMAEQDWQGAAFQKLDETQLDSLKRCPKTQLRHFREGEKIFEAGQRNSNFYVIKSGEVEIVDDS